MTSIIYKKSSRSSNYLGAIRDLQNKKMYTIDIDYLFVTTSIQPSFQFSYEAKNVKRM